MDTTRVANANVSGGISQVGTVLLATGTEHSPLNGEEIVDTLAMAYFVDLSPSLDAQALQLIDRINRVPTAAGCQIRYADEPFGLSPDAKEASNELQKIYPLDEQFSSLSAGSSLVISTPNGAWPELKLVTDADDGYDDDSKVYRTGTEHHRPGYVPDGSFIDIPGDQFPAVAHAALPAVEPITGLATTSSTTPLTSGSTITWEAANAAAEDFVTITIEVETWTQVENNSGNLSRKIAALECTAPDTGVFEVPTELDALLMEGTQTVEEVTLTRVAFAAVQSGDALLLMRAVSGASIDL
jgi:hypothetical protein